MSLRKWTSQEIEYLRNIYNKRSLSYISNKLGRTKESVQHKAQRMNLTLPAPARNEWIQEELDILEKYYEKKGPTFIAKKLNRTLSSVKDKANKLGYNCIIQEKLYVRTIAQCFDCDHSVVKRWCSKFGLKYKREKRGTSEAWLIDTKDFWKWAECHKDIIPWEKYAQGSILPEPSWVKQFALTERKYHEPITPYEIQRIIYLREVKKLTYKKIAEEVHRTMNSVKHIYYDNRRQK